MLNQKCNWERQLNALWKLDLYEIASQEPVGTVCDVISDLNIFFLLPPGRVWFHSKSDTSTFSVDPRLIENAYSIRKY